MISEWVSIQPFAGREERSNFIDIILQHPSLDLGLRNTVGVPLLHAAVKVGDEMAIRTLIMGGADVRSVDNLGQNVLHLSSSVLYSKRLFDDIVALAPELLLQVDNDGKTPLHSAMGSRDQYGRLGNVREGAETFIELLIAAGADTCANSENGDTQLHLLFLSPWILCVDEDDVEAWQGPTKIIMDLLLSNGADINARNEVGETPIFTYLRGGDFKVEITRAYFNKHSPDLVPQHSFQSSEPWSAIERCFAVEKESILWALLAKAGVDWTDVDARGQFLLHVVAGREVYAYSRIREDPISPRVVRFRFLMGKGLDPLAEDGYHWAALDVAAVNSADDILDLFKVE
jgi:hypothetical protein